jgi:hypothetical protein
MQMHSILASEGQTLCDKPTLQALYFWQFRRTRPVQKTQMLCDALFSGVRGD